jgi:hypothetical protein
VSHRVNVVAKSVALQHLVESRGNLVPVEEGDELALGHGDYQIIPRAPSFAQYLSFLGFGNPSLTSSAEHVPFDQLLCERESADIAKQSDGVSQEPQETVPRPTTRDDKEDPKRSMQG